MKYVVSRDEALRWVVYHERADGALQRVTSPALRPRETKEEAELDLQRWLYHRAPITRDHRQHRAARLARQGMKMMQQGEKMQPGIPKAELMVEAKRLLRQAWRELQLGLQEPTDPDHRWYPRPLNIPKLAALLEIDCVQSREVLAAYDQFRQCRKCGCTSHRPCPGGCAWVDWDLCSRCGQ